MGGRIIHTIEATQGITLAAVFERADHPSVGSDVGEVVGLGAKGLKIAPDLQSVMDAGVVDARSHMQDGRDANRFANLTQTGSDFAQTCFP